MKVMDQTKTPGLPTHPERKNWTFEHRQTQHGSMETLPDMGEQGWQLIAVVPCAHDPGTVTAYWERRAS